MKIPTRALTALTEGEADFTITASLAIPSGLQTLPLIKDPVYVCFPETHAFAAAEEIKWKELDGESLVLLATTSAMRGMVDGALLEAQVQERRRIEVSQLVTIYGMVSEGIGVTVLPELALPDPRSTRTLSRKLVGPSLARTISVSWRRDRSITPAGQAFMSCLDEAVRSFS